MSVQSICPAKRLSEDISRTRCFHVDDVGMLDKLRLSCNRCIKIFFGFNKRDNLTNIVFNLGLPSFDALMTNAAVSHTRLWTSCTNSIAMHLRDCVSILCILSNTLLYSFPLSVCLSVFMFVYAFMSLCVVLWALLPELE